ncbi:MAG: DUF1761 domain-containing protein [Nanoarchaeota archaeon]
MLSFDLNWLAVIVVAVVNFFIGFLWYGPIFGKTWMKAMKFTSKDIEASKKKGMAGMMFISFITSLITTFVLAVLLKSTGTIDIVSGILWGVFVWLGFFLVTTVSGILWESKSSKLFFLNASYDLVRVVIMAVILVVWM